MTTRLDIKIFLVYNCVRLIKERRVVGHIFTKKERVFLSKMSHKPKDVNMLMFSITCVVTILILANGAYQLATKRAELNEVETEKRNLEEEISNKEGVISTLNKDVTELADEVTGLSDEVVELLDEVTELSDEVETTQKTVEQLEEEKNALEAEKQNLHNNIKEKEVEIKGLKQLSHKTPSRAQSRVLPKPQQSASRTINAAASFYTARCVGCTGITYTGVDVRNTIHHEGMRVIATDPTVIPMHSIVEVSYAGSTFKAIAMDIGSAIKGTRIDILVGSRDEAYRLGRKDATVRVLREGKGR